MHRPHLLIALSEDLTGISRLPRTLHAAGIHVSVLSPSQFLINRSRFVDQQYRCKQGPDAVAQALHDILADTSCTVDLAVLGDDALLKAVALRAAEPWTHSILPIDLQRVPADIVHSKTVFIQALRGSLEKTLPRSWTCSTSDQIQSAASQLGFPLILKEAFGFAGSGVWKFSLMRELIAYMDSRSNSLDCIIQEFVPGSNLTVDVLFDRGHVRAWVSSQILRTNNGPYGSSSARRFVCMPELAPIVEELGRLTGAHGLCGLDFIYQFDTRRAVLLEVNFRPTAGHSLAQFAQLDFGKQMCAMLRNEPRGEVLQLTRDSVSIPMFPEDWERAITDKDWRGMLKWMFFPSYWKYLPWGDPALLSQHGLNTLKRLAGYPSRVLERMTKKPLSEKKAQRIASSDPGPTL